MATEARPASNENMDNRLPFRLTTNDGFVLEYELSPPSNCDSFFIFSLQKAGSVLLNQIIYHVCRLHQIPIFEPEVLEFQNGLRLGSFDSSILKVLRQRGYCFSGFRCLPEYLFDFDFEPVKKILLIRDPRDILVSQYYSMRFSHELSVGELGNEMLLTRRRLALTTVDSFVLEYAPRLQMMFEDYLRLRENSNLRIYRYEDVIFKKREWINNLLEFLALTISEIDLDEILKEVDVIPNCEDPNSHIRKVTPGDHRNKLQPTTIAILNEIFREILQRYDYEISNPYAIGKASNELPFPTFSFHRVSVPSQGYFAQ